MRKTFAALTVIARTMTTSSPFTASGLYTMDTKGNSHDSAGKFAKKSLGALAAVHTNKLDAKRACHGETGKFVEIDLCKS
jgi:hypothetical protein